MICTNTRQLIISFSFSSMAFCFATRVQCLNEWMYGWLTDELTDWLTVLMISSKRHQREIKQNDSNMNERHLFLVDFKRTAKATFYVKDSITVRNIRIFRYVRYKWCDISSAVVNFWTLKIFIWKGKSNKETNGKHNVLSKSDWKIVLSLGGGNIG